MTQVLTNAKAAAALASIQVDDQGQAMGTQSNPININSGQVAEAPNMIVKSTTDLVPPATGNQSEAGANGRMDALMSQSMPEMVERARLGGMYSVAIPTASAFNFVAAWPTTRAELVLFNGEPQGGKSYVIESAWVSTLVSPAASAALSLLAQLVPSGTAPTDNANVLVVSRSGKANYGGNVLKAIANTSYGVASDWECVGTTFGGSGAAQIGTSVIADLEGGWILRPGSLLLLNAVSGTVATGAGIIGVTWTEVLLPVV